MSRRPLDPVEGAFDRRASRMAPGGRLRSEAPIKRLYPMIGGMGVEPLPPSGCACWDVPASALPSTSVEIWTLNYEWYATCLPEYGNYYGNDTVLGVGSGHSWEATMGQGTHVTVTIAESASAVYIQMFVGDTHDKLDLYVYPTDFSTEYTITSATICPAPPGCQTFTVMDGVPIAGSINWSMFYIDPFTVSLPSLLFNATGSTLPAVVIIGSSASEICGSTSATPEWDEVGVSWRAYFSSGFTGWCEPQFVRIYEEDYGTVVPVLSAQLCTVVPA